VLGYDTTSSQRAFGTPTGGNANVPCTGSFGDTKGLDLWTYYTTPPVSGELSVADQPAEAAALTLLATPDTGTGVLEQSEGGVVVAVIGLVVAAVAGRRRTAIQAPISGSRRGR